MCAGGGAVRGGGAGCKRERRATLWLTKVFASTLGLALAWQRWPIDHNVLSSGFLHRHSDIRTVTMMNHVLCMCVDQTAAAATPATPPAACPRLGTRSCAYRTLRLPARRAANVHLEQCRTLPADRLKIAHAPDGLSSHGPLLQQRAHNHRPCFHPPACFEPVRCVSRRPRAAQHGLVASIFRLEFQPPRCHACVQLCRVRRGAWGSARHLQELPLVAFIGRGLGPFPSLVHGAPARASWFVRGAGGALGPDPFLSCACVCVCARACMYCHGRGAWC